MDTSFWTLLKQISFFFHPSDIHFLSIWRRNELFSLCFLVRQSDILEKGNKFQQLTYMLQLKLFASTLSFLFVN